jgi:hypothetical protein
MRGKRQKGYKQIQMGERKGKKGTVQKKKIPTFTRREKNLVFWGGAGMVVSFLDQNIDPSRF